MPNWENDKTVNIEDSSKNWAYKMAIEDVEMGYARINEITKIIENIKKD